MYVAHLVPIEDGDDGGVKARPEEELPHKEALHDTLHLTEAKSEADSVVGERLHKTRLPTHASNNDN